MLKYCKGDLFYGKTLSVDVEKLQRVEADFKCFGKPVLVIIAEHVLITIACDVFQSNDFN